MTCEEARKLLWQEPFQPVRVRLKDGRTFDLFHPRSCMAAEAIFIIGVYGANDRAKRYPIRSLWVQWSDVDKIELLESPSAATS